MKLLKTMILLGLGVVLGFSGGFYFCHSQPARLIQELQKEQNPTPIKPKKNHGAMLTGIVDFKSIDTRQIGETEKQQLESLGYLSGYTLDEGKPVIEKYDSAAAFNSMNVMLSGHEPEAFLMDMNGNLVHKWACPISKAFTNLKPDNDGKWRRVELLPNGDLLAIFEGHGMVKVDKDSNILWVIHDKCHHDLDFDDEGNIYTLTRESVSMAEINDHQPITGDFISVYSGNGEFIRKVPILDAFLNSSFASLLACMPTSGDVLHTNSIQVLDGSLRNLSSHYEKGNVLISMRHTNAIAILDMTTQKIVWTMTGQWMQQHDAKLLINGNILLFDNKGCQSRSKVIEFDPMTQEIAWVYRNSPNNPLYSSTSGCCQRLPNGNTLISESNAGTAIELTRDLKKVWIFNNPIRTGKNNEMIAVLYSMHRLPVDFPLEWLQKKAS